LDEESEIRKNLFRIPDTGVKRHRLRIRNTGFKAGNQNVPSAEDSSQELGDEAVEDEVDKPPADPSDDDVEDDSRTGTRKDPPREVEGANGTACKQDLDNKIM
jgi:hypothetical protein